MTMNAAWRIPFQVESSLSQRTASRFQEEIQALVRSMTQRRL